MSRNSLDSRFLLPAFTTRLIRFDDVFFVFFFFLLYKEKDKEREKTLVGNRRNREVI